MPSFFIATVRVNTDRKTIKFLITEEGYICAYRRWNFIFSVLMLT